MAKSHLLLVVFFKNTSLLLEKTSRTIQEYMTIIAEKLMYEKKQIVNELKNMGFFRFNQTKNLQMLPLQF